MATRSTIAMLFDDGHVEQIYCHFDGQPDHNGRILKEYYPTGELVKKLMSLGDLSYLAPNIDGSASHSFETPEDGVCVFYGRDNGESDTDARTFSDLNTFVSDMSKENFDYLFVEKWLRWYLVKNKRLVTF